MTLELHFEGCLGLYQTKKEGNIPAGKAVCICKGQRHERMHVTAFFAWESG
jgi:hypothetical protein